LPTYDYQCDACGARYELHQSFSAPTTHTCEKCGAGTAKRKLTPPRIIFKGSGWYATDSRNGKQATLDSPSSSEKPAGSGTGDTAASSTSTSESAGTGSDSSAAAS
jgi:putative FmdB family regulatory protein